LSKDAVFFKYLVGGIIFDPIKTNIHGATIAREYWLLHLATPLILQTSVFPKP